MIEDANSYFKKNDSRRNARANFTTNPNCKTQVTVTRDTSTERLRNISSGSKNTEARQSLKKNNVNMTTAQASLLSTRRNS
jgi:hypothetical protein